MGEPLLSNNIGETKECGSDLLTNGNGWGVVCEVP